MPTALDGAWIYSGDPSGSPKDAVRFLLGDTDPADPLLTDGEINFLLVGTDPYSAAAAGADQLASRFAREVSYSADGVSYGGSELQAKFEQMGVNLRATMRRRNKAAAPYVGGISPYEVRSHENDDSVIKPDFGTGMHDHPGSGQTGYGNKHSNPLLGTDY